MLFVFHNDLCFSFNVSNTIGTCLMTPTGLAQLLELFLKLFLEVAQSSQNFGWT